MRIAREPDVAFAALAGLLALFAEATGRNSNTPVLGAMSEACDRNQTHTDASN
jgi:hypothetical protein